MISFSLALDNLQNRFELLMQTDVIDHCPPDFSPVSCIVADVYFPWMQDVANKFNLPRVLLWTTPVHANLAYYHQPLLMSENLIPVKEKDSAGKIVQCVPGVIPLPASDLISFFHQDDYYFQWCLKRELKRTGEAAWNLGNNFFELESREIEAFQKNVPSFLPIGPLLPPAFLKEPKGTHDQSQRIFHARPSLWPEDSSSWQKWLDSQQASSVLYISFGSIVALPEKQLEELALGLEASKQPFLWAVRAEVKSSIFKEFVDRTRGRLGMVVWWASQLEILSHESVAGFLTHCGWNSVLESVSAGVPLLAMAGGFAEQCMNAKYVVDDWKVGSELRSQSADGLVLKPEIECGIREFMNKIHDAQFKQHMVKMSALACASASLGGSSYKNLEMFVSDMRRRVAS